MKIAAGVVAVGVVLLGGIHVYTMETMEARIMELVPSISAKCNDGTYSASSKDRGTCSGHGGVARWIK